jgi:hypothetical protein
MASLIDHYLQEMAVSVVDAEESERVYREVRDEYYASFDHTVTAEFKAATDPRLQKAIGDGQYFRARATMYATAAVAVQLDEQRKRGAL